MYVDLPSEILETETPKHVKLVKIAILQYAMRTQNLWNTVSQLHDLTKSWSLTSTIQ